ILHVICKVSLLKNIVKKAFAPRSGVSVINVFGLHFPNPVGLAAGFDKNAKYLTELFALGFGYIEIGTVTPLPQEGNPEPRLFRLQKDQALINRMGFNNDGVEVIASRLKHFREANVVKGENYIVGGNIGKNKNTPNEEAWQDYQQCFIALHDYVDYFVINVSSPNTPGLRDLQQKYSLEIIISHLKEINASRKNPRPLLLKISPDLSVDALDEIIQVAMSSGLDGLVVSNTTIARDELTTSLTEINKKGAGGLSGKPLAKRSTKITKYIHEKTKGKIPIISSGGIFTGTDASEKLQAGASLVQVWTGFIYEGPSIVKKICSGLIENS
ncbi:MAG: quinone-dependent dihydroorotate dehydrogenase, partial [Ginsengibacter sp.]